MGGARVRGAGAPPCALRRTKAAPPLCAAISGGRRAPAPQKRHARVATSARLLVVAVNLSTFSALLTAEARAALAQLAQEELTDARTLALLTALRGRFPPEVASALLKLARLRQRAARKFARAEAMFFTEEALQQASDELVATWRARRFAALGPTRLADLGCGVGGDTLALAALPRCAVYALDRDALRLRMARENLRAYGRHAHLLQADLRDPLPLRGVEAAFFDPARRVGEQRVFSVRHYVPPLDVLRGWNFCAWGVKLSPAVRLQELQPYLAQGAGVEFVSLEGALKEAVLWGGALGFSGRQATRLTSAGSGDTLRPAALPPLPLSEPRAVLYEPDPSVMRAGLLSELAVRLGVPLYRLDAQIAYLTADRYVPSAWARAWPIWTWLPFNLKRLRRVLRSRGVGRVTVKKRGSPLGPEELLRRLKLHGDGEEAVVVLTQVKGRHSALVCGPPCHAPPSAQ